MSSVDSLIDAFVQHINGQPREAFNIEDVPAFLREETTGDPKLDALDFLTGWRIAKLDNSARIAELQRRAQKPFPPSFHYFVANYSFPAFDCGPFTFFANTGTDTHWELETRLFLDPHMSPYLLRAGFVQIGNPFFPNYDPVCFDCNGRALEPRIVQLDHEEILYNDRTTIVQEIAQSFPDLLHAVVGG
jgi:hypothetical protein